MKIKTTPICSYCPEVDTIAHYFMQCSSIHRLWQEFCNWWNIVSPEVVLDFPHYPNVENIIFGIPFNGNDDKKIVLNFWILHAKYYIII